MKRLVLILCLLTCSIFFSQEYQKKYKFNFQFDNRFSNIRDYQITIFGAKMGVQYKNLTRFGFGASFIINPVDITGTLQIKLKNLRCLIMEVFLMALITRMKLDVENLKRRFIN